MNVKEHFFINLRENVCVGATLSHTCIFSVLLERIYSRHCLHTSEADPMIELTFIISSFFCSSLIWFDDKP